VHSVRSRPSYCDDMGTRHPIDSRQRRFEVDPARFDQFELGRGRPISDDELLDDPTWTLFAIDPEHDRALLLRMPEGVDLTTKPFAFVAQFEHAVEAAVVSIDQLSELAESLPRPARTVHLFSTGRCGSTLASRIFAELDGLWSMSEPDAIGQLVPRRSEYGTDRMRMMLRAATQWSFRPIDGRTDRTCVLKYRSEALFDVADYLAATPDSSALFLYRDLTGWVDSAHRFGQKQGVGVSTGSHDIGGVVWPLLSADAPPEAVDDICDPLDPETPAELVLAALWTLRIEAFASTIGAGLPLHPFSYRQLNHERDATVAALLGLLGHDSPENRERARRAYDADSQQGTVGARDRAAQPLHDRQRERLAAWSVDHPRIRNAVEHARNADRGRS